MIALSPACAQSISLIAPISLIYIQAEENRVGKLTLKKTGGKVNANIPIPELFTPLYHPGDRLRFQLLETHQNPVLGAEANNNLRDSKQEGLRPKLEEFTLEFDLVAVGLDFSGCFELDPIDGLGGVGGFAVPDFGGRGVSLKDRFGNWRRVGVWEQSSVSLPASTSPPIIILILPKPVRTMEQYCAWLSTIWSSRDSMYSREVRSQGSGTKDSVSNL